MEYGIFNDEGLVEGAFCSESDAQASLTEEYGDDDCHVGAVCPDHEEHEAATCELCLCDEEADEEADEDDEECF